MAIMNPRDIASLYDIRTDSWIERESASMQRMAMAQMKMMQRAQDQGMLSQLGNQQAQPKPISQPAPNPVLLLLENDE